MYVYMYMNTTMYNPYCIYICTHQIISSKIIVPGTLERVYSLSNTFILGRVCVYVCVSIYTHIYLFHCVGVSGVAL
ncbi:hypothetical protein BDB01DRAFT_811596 [Pilobolus umbonatus]|nr:hypothetical protein BDB01DRAFT_811596 [Pilobolus umbonatus]